MILDQRVPCRASRAWLFSFAPAALTMLGAPVLAQGEGEREEVRIEIRVNGKSLDELGAIERRVLLQKLLGDERRDAPPERVREERVAKKDVREPKVYVVRKGDSLARIAKSELGSAERFEEILRLNPDLEPLRLRVGQKLRLPRVGGDAHDVFVEVHEDVLQDVTHEFQGLPGSLDVVLRDGRIAGELRGALREVRDELQGDADLRELGITDEVTALVDDLAAGKGLQGSLDNVIKAAMKGASRIAIREIEADEDLRDLGITSGVKALVTGLLENEHNQALIGDLARQAAKGALRKAKAEIEADVDLRDLRITGEVSGLVEGLFEGGDFDANLERLIEKVLRHVGEEEVKGRKAAGDEGRKDRSVIR